MRKNLEDFLDRASKRNNGMPVYSWVQEVMRDTFQSRLNNRVASRHQIEMANAIAEALPAGNAVEQNGGNFFEGCVIRGEDPYRLLEDLSGIFVKHGILRTSLNRAQNIVTLDPHSDEVVDLYAKVVLEPFVDITDVFDSCNFLPNMESAIRSALNAGLVVSGNVCFDPPEGEPVIDTVNRMKEFARGLKEMGSHMLRVKDPLGILTKEYIGPLCEALRNLDMPFGFHSHESLGVGVENYSLALELGAQFVSTIVSSWSGGNSHPALESVWLGNKQRFPDFDRDKLIKYAKKARGLRDIYAVGDSGINVMSLVSSVIPGGMIGPLLDQMDQQGISRSKFEEIISMVNHVRGEARQSIVRVTPASQIIGIAAINYFLYGNTYALISKGFRLLMQGWFGQVDGEVNGQLAQEHPELREYKYNLLRRQIPDGLKEVIESNTGSEKVHWQNADYFVNWFSDDRIGAALKKRFGDYILNRPADILSNGDELRRGQTLAESCGSSAARDILGVCLFDRNWTGLMEKRGKGQLKPYEPPPRPPLIPIYPEQDPNLDPLIKLMTEGDYPMVGIIDNTTGRTLTFERIGLKPKGGNIAQKVEITPGQYDYVLYSNTTGDCYFRPKDTSPTYLPDILRFLAGDDVTIRVKKGDVALMLYPMKQIFEQTLGQKVMPDLLNPTAEDGATYKLVKVFIKDGERIAEIGTPLMAFMRVT